ncbi:WhiB family transcriptional regulator [Streptomyces sp. NPDC058471]|uniref:WhiB family transcriptional regulator n=1 Tax=Streptomyces sp. NPDC058471 TaxID=3346516 RepID=UPI003654A347
MLRPCLARALYSGQAHGVWGGASTEERAVLHRQGSLTHGSADRVSAAAPRSSAGPAGPRAARPPSG